jgi:TPR repeat protein
MKFPIDATARYQLGVIFLFACVAYVGWWFEENRYAISQPCSDPPENATAQHYRALANQGDAGAQYWMGVMVSVGCYHGVTRDVDESIRWFRAAAEQEDRYAQASMASHYWYGYGVILDHHEAYYWIYRAAAHGEEQHIKARDFFRQFVPLSARAEIERRAEAASAAARARQLKNTR